MMSNVYPLQRAQTNGRDTDPEIFTVWKKPLLFSGTGFTVFDSSGNLVLRVENYAPTVKRQLLVMDASGRPLLLLRRKAMSLHHRWEGFVCDGKSKLWVFTIKRSSIISATTSVDIFLTCYYTNCSRKQSDYHIEGSFRERSCTIYNRSRSIVAQVKRKKSCQMLLEKDVFSVEIYRNFDPALIMSWIVVVDHINSEDLRVVTQAALYCTFRPYQLLKIVDVKRKGDCTTGKGSHVNKASAPNKKLQQEALNASIIHI